MTGPATANRNAPARPRRGHALVLVAAALALLAIVAVSYLGRAQSGRATAVAVRHTAQRDANDRLIADAIAREIAEALFARPLDPAAVAPGATGDDLARARRLVPAPSAPRYGHDPRFPANFAPYHVVPWTNPPDGGAYAALDANLSAANPPGPPGFGDTRWLRDNEPLRSYAGYGAGVRDEVFRFWPHLTTLARADNGWRLCTNIADVTDADADGTGGLLDLAVPAESWLPARPPSPALFDPVSGDAILDEDFLPRWGRWFADHAGALAADPGGSQALVPPNLYHLKDLDADGRPLEPGERPSDEWLGPGRDPRWPAGSPRWRVATTLADTDGDGFTDAFWHLAPAPVEDGVRHLVAVSIVDNAGRFNANVATRFRPGAAPDAASPGRTMGETPADLAATGAQTPWDGDGLPPATWNVGFLDDYGNWEHGFEPLSPGTALHRPDRLDVGWNPARWADQLLALGAIASAAAADDAFATALERRRHWLDAGLRPFAPRGGRTPFTVADELELVLHAGQNHPWILSRFERALNVEQGSALGDEFFLRSPRTYHETSPHRDQLSNRELLHDNRRKMTLLSAARNDERPPWLRWRGAVPSAVEDAAAAEPEDADGNGRADVVDRFLDRTRSRVDLRAPAADERLLAARLAEATLLALTDGEAGGAADGGPAGSYLGPYSGATPHRQRDLRRLAASYAANVLAYRDRDDAAPLDPDPATGAAGAVPLPPWGDPADGGFDEDPGTRFLGLERQPFLVEAFVAHAYETFVVPGDDVPGNGVPGWTNSGTRVVLETDDAGRTRAGTIAVVQLANPFDAPIVLWDPAAPERPAFEVDFFGQTISLREIGRALAAPGTPWVLEPSRPGRRSTLILHAVDERLAAADDFGPRWIDYLDLEPDDHPAATHIVDLRGPALAGVIEPWTTRREHYDAGVVTAAVALVRRDAPVAAGASARVVVDRFDPPDAGGATFAALVRGLGADRPPRYDALAVPPPSDDALVAHPDPAWTPTDPSRTHWVQFARVSRAWGYDVDGDGDEGPRERHPRYVNASRTLTTAPDRGVEASAIDDDPRGEAVYRPRLFRGGVSFTLASDPDAEPADAAAPWMTLDYSGPGAASPDLNHKVAFFDLAGAAGDVDPRRLADKGFHHSPFPLQMLQKDDDFQQVGELLYVWLWTHELAFDGGGDDGGDDGGDYARTIRTFSEQLAAETPLDPAAAVRVNRLAAGPTIGVARAAADLTDPLHAVPDLPAGLRLLDAVVCDGPGAAFDPATDDPRDHVFGNAAGFTGRATPGLVNVNTAAVEVLRTLPHWRTLCPVDANVAPPGAWPRSALPEAVVAYRERFGGTPGAGGPGAPGGADHSDRGDGRDDRGIAAIGELLLLDRAAAADAPWSILGSAAAGAWRIDHAAHDPFAAGGGSAGGALSVDVVGPADDGVAGDAEEAALLFAGASNLVTTRSDLFTVHFRVRSFRRDPVTRRWDATIRENVLDDRRYVMIVDRSGVNRPADRPRVLALERLPD